MCFGCIQSISYRVDHYKLFNILMDWSLPRQFIALLFEWFAKMFCLFASVCLFVNTPVGLNFSWSQTRRNFSVYKDPLIMKLRR